MINSEIAFLFKKIAAAYLIQDEKKFRFQIIAYQRAADAIEHSTSELKDLWDDGKLDTIPGLGASIIGHLDELFKTGTVKYFEDVLKPMPQAMFILMKIPSIGPKTAYKLSKILQLSEINAINELQKAVEEHKIRDIEGFGEKSEQEVLIGINAYRKGETKENRMLLPFASSIAEEIITYLKLNTNVIQAETLGSLRRKVATIGDIDIAVTTQKPKEVIEYFTKYPRVSRVLGKGEHSSSRIILTSGRQVDLLVQSEKGFGALLQHFTGSKNHNISLRELAIKKGLSLSEYGIKKKGKLYEYKTEEEFYHAIGLQWIPPELREDTGEIEASLRQAQGKQNGLPELVTLNDIKGDQQIHSDFPIEPSHDLGSSSMEEIVGMAMTLKYEYVGFSEHNPSVGNHSEKQIIDILKKRQEKIEKLQSSTKIRIISLLEVDILLDGNLAISNQALELLDGVIASIHTSFNQSREIMTERIISALKNPYVRFLGHPTGRLLNEREGYEADWNKIFQVCKEYDKALEINAFPNRLDLPDALVRSAINAGVKLIINTDSHDISQMDLIKYGVYVARRGWATKHDIINTLGYNDFIKWIHKRN